jgi:general secretion pathway protein K
MPALRRSPPIRQRGVAVITALLLTTLAITIVASLFWQQQVQVRSMENQRLHLQTKWILRGALDWAALVLRQDGQDHANYTALEHVWATPLAETRLDQYIERERVEGEVFDATLSGNIIDASSRYNLGNLASQRIVQPDQVRIYAKLLSNLALDPSLAARTARFIAEGQVMQSSSQAAAASQSGAPGGVTSGTSTPGISSGTATTGTPVAATSGSTPMALTEVNDLLAVPGYTPQMIEKLREFVIVLPEFNLVNVNTAPAEVLGAVIENYSVGEASSLVARRKRSSWNNEPLFVAELLATTGKKPEPNAIDIKSSYFLVRSRIRLDRAALNAEALMYREPGMRHATSVLWVRQN